VIELAAAAAVFAIGWWAVSLAAGRWRRFRKRHRRALQTVPWIVAGLFVAFAQIARSGDLVAVAVAGAIVTAVFVVLMVVTSGGVQRRRVVEGAATPLGMPVPPQVRAVPGAQKGLYAIGFGNRQVDGGSTVTDWKVGHGDIERRVAAHTSAVAHPRLVLARLPCEGHEQLERRVLRDLHPWKINVPTIPGEELFDATPQVEAYLRVLFTGSGGTWEER
jgi:hypothetical protein